jgi:hypothetical protein
MRVSPLILLPGLLVGCAAMLPARDSRDVELQRLAAMLVGDYFSGADGGVREGRPIYLRIRRIDAPAGQALALYAEMRHDGANGELYRQRLYLFDEAPGRAGNAMRALGFADSAAATRLIEDPAALRRDALRTTEIMAGGCAMSWRVDGAGFTGRVDPSTCEITGKRGDRRRIESITHISADSISQLERGFDLDGRLLFGNAGDELYVWPRVTAQR